MSVSVRVEDLLSLAPLVVVVVWACLQLLVSAFGGGRNLRGGPLAVFGLLLAAATVPWCWMHGAATGAQLFGGMVVADRFALFVDLLVIVAALLTVLTSGPYLREHRFADDDYYVLVLLALAGMMVMVHAGNFLMLVLGLETMSLAVYALVASWLGRMTSAEGGIKYFVMGAVASAFLLYGIALLYAAAGTISYGSLGRAMSQLAGQPIALIGMLMVFGAMAFKVAFVPFHMWLPDAYEGAPTPVMGFMAAAVKTAGFAALLRIVSSVFSDEAFRFGSAGWTTILYPLAILTMTLGNLAALRQRSIKRMLAYSSISHAGYLAIGVLIQGVASTHLDAVLFYLLSYGLTIVGALAVVAWVGSRDAERLTLDEWAGLGHRHPVVALVMTVFLLSLAGFPPTAGFFAKFYLFRAALSQPQLVLLVVIAVLNSVVSVFYYLRPIVAMYFREEARPSQPLAAPGINAALTISVAAVILLGILPGPALRLASAALMGH